MSKTIEPTMNEMINSAGDGSGLQLPPAFVLVNPKQHRKYKKNNQDKIDGRTRGAKNLLSRISKRRQMKEELETLILEKAPTETERVQQQISKEKELDNRRYVQKRRDENKKKVMDKADRAKKLADARLRDLKQSLASKTKQLKNSTEHNNGEIIMESTQKLDAVEVALQVATSELTHGETQFAKIQFDDGSVQNLDNFSAKKIAATYASLSPENQEKFRYMLNKDASTYQSAIDFAVRNI